MSTSHKAFMAIVKIGVFVSVTEELIREVDWSQVHPLQIVTIVASLGLVACESFDLAKLLVHQHRRQHGRHLRPSRSPLPLALLILAGSMAVGGGLLYAGKALGHTRGDPQGQATHLAAEKACAA